MTFDMGKVDSRHWLFRPGVFRLLLMATVVLHHTTYIGIGKWGLFSFFILSGYWVARMYEERYRHMRHSTLVFISSRYFRMLPVFVFCVALNAATLIAIDKNADAIRAAVASPEWILRNLLIISSSQQPVFLTPIWSLDVELQFYLLAPLFIWVVKKLDRWIVPLLVPLVLWNAWIVPRWSAPSAGYVYHYAALFLIGVAMYHRRWTCSLRVALISLAAFFLICVGLLAHPYWRMLIMSGRVYSELFDYCAPFSLLAAVLTLPYLVFHVHNPSPPIDRHISNATYAIFLFHFTPCLVLIAWARQLSLGELVLGEAIVWFLSFAGGGLLYWVLDRPIEAYRGRVFRAFEVPARQKTEERVPAELAGA